MSKFIDNLKKQAEENPVLAIGVGAAVAQVATKLIKTLVETQNSHTWKKEVARRTRNSARTQ